MHLHAFARVSMRIEVKKDKEKQKKEIEKATSGISHRKEACVPLCSFQAEKRKEVEAKMAEEEKLRQELRAQTEMHSVSEEKLAQKAMDQLLREEDSKAMRVFA